MINLGKVYKGVLYNDSSHSSRGAQLGEQILRVLEIATVSTELLGVIGTVIILVIGGPPDVRFNLRCHAIYPSVYTLRYTLLSRTTIVS